MSIPPCLMHMKIRDHVDLWIPLFLVWLIVAIFALALAPIMLILVLILWPIEWGRFLLMSGPAIYRCLCALRGLEVDINQSEERLFFAFR
jgi:hypothetical protein